MKTINLLTFFLLAGILGITGCGGTGEDASASNESQLTREVTGSLASPNGAALIKATHLEEGDGCVADTVIATTTRGEATQAEVEEDCSFSLTLTTGQSYVISFALDDEFLATLIFDSGITGNLTSTLPLSKGGALNLGTITITGNLATPEHEPLDECDQDGDGEYDLEDEDDDEDGVEDEREEDCDFDGSLDDYDEEDAACQEEEGEEGEEDHAHVLSVKPYDDPEGYNPVDLEREVKARIDCEVEQSSVTPDTFYVESENGEHRVECRYEFSGSGENGNKIECDHDDFEDFLPNTIYVATLDSILCTDGRMVESISWTWLTEEEDSEEGCFEDELDDEDELEEEEEEEDDDDDDDEDEEDNENDDEDNNDEDEED